MTDTLQVRQRDYIDMLMSLDAAQLAKQYLILVELAGEEESHDTARLYEDSQSLVLAIGRYRFQSKWDAALDDVVK